MSLSYLNDNQMAFDDLLASVNMSPQDPFSNTDFDHLLASAYPSIPSYPIDQAMLDADFSLGAAPYGMEFHFPGDASDQMAGQQAWSGPESPGSVGSYESAATLASASTDYFGSLIIPGNASCGFDVDLNNAAVAAFAQSQDMSHMFPMAPAAQPKITVRAYRPQQVLTAEMLASMTPTIAAPVKPAKVPAKPKGKTTSAPKRQHRAPTVAWPPAPSSTTSTSTSTRRAQTTSPSLPSMPSPTTTCMPSPPLSPTKAPRSPSAPLVSMVSVKDETFLCDPSPMAMDTMKLAASGFSLSERTATGGIKTPFDDMADDELDELEEEDIMGLLGKRKSEDGKKKRKRRSTADLAPQELQVRRIKNSAAARRCRLRKTLRLRWLEARCTEMEETNVKLVERLADLERLVAAK